MSKTLIVIRVRHYKQSWMAWRYGEARVIKHVVTSPLPLTPPPNAEADKLGKKPLQCSLRYWDDIRCEYIELTTFALLHRYVLLAAVTFPGAHILLSFCSKDDRNKLVECIKLEKAQPAREWQVCIANANQLSGYADIMFSNSVLINLAPVRVLTCASCTVSRLQCLD
jgi:hypothetical protein